MQYNHIAIEGNIGSGKTSLATNLSRIFNAKLILEKFADNPFLPKFYKNPEKYAFPLEMFFLAERYQQLKSQVTQPDLFNRLTVSDYFIQKSLIFSKNNLGEDEYQLFYRLFEIVKDILPNPGLLVYLYLEVDKLQDNIKKRGRNFEQDITDEYLKNVEKQYFEFLKQNQANYRILILDINDIDFVDNPGDFEKVTEVLAKDYDKGFNSIKL